MLAQSVSPPVVGTIHQQLYQAVVFQDRHAGFPLASVDQDLALQMMPSAAAVHRSPAPPALRHRRGAPISPCCAIRTAESASNGGARNSISAHSSIRSANGASNW